MKVTDVKITLGYYRNATITISQVHGVSRGEFSDLPEDMQAALKKWVEAE